jgi:hypothetical protein
VPVLGEGVDGGGGYAEQGADQAAEQRQQQGFSMRLVTRSLISSRAALSRHARSACVITWPAMRALSLLAEVPDLPVPGLGADLDCFPGAAKRWGVGQIEVAHLLDRHVGENGRRGDIDPLGDLRVLVAE